MFRLHCNKCYHLRSQEPTLALNLTRCHHIICANCLERSSLEDPKKCPLCSQPLQTIPIDRNMPSGMAQYFEDPTRFLKLYQKISKFQGDQRTSDNVGFWQQMERQRDLELQLQGYNKIEMQLNQQIEREKKRIEEMRKYIEYYEKAAPSGSSSSHRGRRGSRSSQERGSRPHTPSVTTTTTDTSMEKENNFFMDTTADDFGPKKRRNDKNFHI
ncbi:RING finger protein nenya-like [Drosophila kikkawai]|uniref:RING finger protein nenya-like n=1 Tax=Drosophila kikkawai TaxID=30033 RepID=A0A6P4JL10_DROKI|nr:RING finger protein nenya-like [Drosophila kikkawai]KAH8345102.1 hypothetical protein KR059_004906 [Drosophila kikkawai]